MLSKGICLFCRTARSLSTSNAARITQKQITKQHEEITWSCSSWVQNRNMSNKPVKTVSSIHRKDASCVGGDGEDKYQPQSPYRERWPIHYGWENKMFGGGTLPKLEKPLKNTLKKEKPADQWDKDHALFGQNDYIDILGDGDVRPVDLMKGPSWLRGFKGNEMQRIIRRLEHEGDTLEQLYPTKYHNIQKRLDYLYKHYNLRRSKKIGKGRKTVQK